MNYTSVSSFRRSGRFASAWKSPLFASIAGLLAVQAAHADLTWNSAGPTDLWDTAAGNENWLPGSVVWTQNENAIFSTGAEAINLGATDIIFNDLTFGVTGFSIGNTGAGSLRLANDFASTITVTNAADSASIAEVIANNGTTASSLTKAGAGTLVLSGTNTYTGLTTVTGGTLSVGVSANLGTGTAVTLNGGGLAITTSNQTFAQGFTIGAGGGTMTVPSVSQATTLTGVFSGAGQLTFGGTSDTAFNGANTYSGGTVINAGRVRITTAAAIGTGAVTVNGSGGSGGQLYASGGITLANNFTISGLGGNANDGVQRGAVRIDNATVNGTVTFTAASGIGANGGNTGTVNGVVNAGGFDFRKTDTGTINLSAPNTNFGNIIIGTNGQTAGGTLGITGAGSLNGGAYAGTISAGTSATSATFNFASSTNQTLSGIMSGVVSLTKAGTSTLTLTATNARAGTTTVNAGTLKLDYGASNTAKLGTASGMLTFGGGTLELSGGSFTGDVAASTALTAGTSSFITSTNGSTAVLNLNAITRNAGAMLNFSTGGIATTDTTNTNGILGPWATIGQSDWAANSTNAVDGLITAAAYTDLTRLSSGAKLIPNDPTANVRVVEGTGSVGDLTLAGATAINTLNQSTTGGTSAVTVATGGNTLTVNGILIGTGAGALTVGASANDGTIKSAGTELVVTHYSTNAATINSAVADGTGASTLIKTGTGALVLNGTNTFTGATTVANGTLQIGGAGSLGFGSYAATIANNGTLQYSSSTTQALAGIISGTGSLVKDTSSASTLTLSATNTFAGGVTISAGTVAVSNFNGLGTGAVTNNGTLTLSATPAASSPYTGLSTSLSGTGTMNVTNLGTGTNTAVFNGNYSAFTGTWNVGVGVAAGAGKVQMNGADNAAATVSVEPNGTVYVSAAVTKNASLILKGGDTGETLGQIRVENGVWAGGITLAGTITGTGDAFIGSAGTGTISGNIGESGGSRTLSKGGTGTVILTGTTSHTGGTSILAGTLTIGGAGSLGSGNYPGNISNAGTFSYGSTAAQTLSGVISGTGVLVKSAASTLTLTGANTFTGGTTLTGGTLAITGSGSLGGGAYAGIISGSGATLTFDTSVVHTLSGANTFSGAMNFNSGKVILSNQGASNSSSYTIASGATLEMNVATGTRSMATSSVLNGTGTFIKSGTGLLQWAAAAGTFSLGSGALIDVQSGTLVGGSSANEVWTNNKADLDVASGATFDAVEATSVANGGVFVDALTGSGAIKVGYAGVYANTITFGVDNGSGTFAGTLANSQAAGNFVKSGTGTQTLDSAGTYSYTGTTTVNGGALLVNGSISGSTTTVNAGGTLGGTGTLATVNVLGGSVAPGTSAGTLNTGAFSLNSASTLKFELAQAGVVGGGINDLISVTGALTLDGTLQVTQLAGFSEGTYRLFNYTGALTDNGLGLEAAFLAANPGSTIDVATVGQVNLVVVPEPGSALSLLGGLGVLLGLRRRRRA